MVFPNPNSSAIKKLFGKFAATPKREKTIKVCANTSDAIFKWIAAVFVINLLVYQIYGHDFLDE
jgi:hypothetical protein